jgi:Fe(3+) dicitrate transport protein
VAGVHVVDEEGAGMRINIGIRGLDPDRSRSVLVLEDGIPVALNPYGEPEMYYSPVIDRMAGVEVLKGSGQIVYGPQTIGGVVNYVTANPTPGESGKLRLMLGSGGLTNALLSYSNTYKNTGIITSLQHKRANQLGYASFDITDFSTKLMVKTGLKSNLMIKLGVYNENSNSTYIGLTQSMFDQQDNDFVLMAPDDRLGIKRLSASVSHVYEKNPRFRINSSVYGYTISRNWQRQDFSSSKTTSNKTGQIWGDTSIPGAAIYMRNQNAHRNRSFEVLGAETKMTYKFQLKGVKNEWVTGMRYLFERANEQRINGKKADALSGDLVEDEIRTGLAFSAYTQNQASIGKKLVITAGLRLEQYTYQRQILRNTFTVNSVAKVLDTNLISENSILNLIPGIGANVLLKPGLTIFIGIHKGYAPPRIKDAISNSGEVYQLNAEESWNYELGLRGKYKNALTYEICAYRLDFSNQIIPVSESSGGTGAGLVNGGATINQGVEAAFKWHLSEWLKTKTKLSVNGSFTFTDARFNDDRFVNSGLTKVNVNNNFTPYAPKYFHNMGLNVEFPKGFGCNINANMVGQQFTDALNSVTPSADGRNGLISAYNVLDAGVFAKLAKYGLYANFTVKNVLNERYIVSKRPQGIRVGLPRYYTFSLQYEF